MRIAVRSGRSERAANGNSLRARGLLCSAAVPRSKSRILVWNGGDRLTCDGVAVGLLRDNVEHFFVRHERQEPMVHLHALADIVWKQWPAHLVPSQLCAELNAGWDQVWRVPIRDMVMSDGTRALLRTQLGPFPQPIEVASWLQRQNAIGPRCKTVGELIANLVHELFALAARAQPGDVLCCATARMLDDPGAFDEARAAVLGPSGPYRH